MLYAEINNKRVAPEKGLKASCPLCQEDVIAKCGDIMTWHFAHVVGTECAYGEGKGEWHREWQKRFPIEDVEYRVTKGKKFRIADVKIGDKVLEFQNIGISLETIKDREEFYGFKNVVWVFNGTDSGGNFELIKDKYSSKRLLAKWKKMPLVLQELKGRLFINFYKHYLYDVRGERVLLHDEVNGLVDVTEEIVNNDGIFWGDRKIKSLENSFKGYTISYICVNNRPKRLANKPLPRKKDNNNNNPDKIEYYSCDNTSKDMKISAMRMASRLNAREDVLKMGRDGEITFEEMRKRLLRLGYITTNR